MQVSVQFLMSGVSSVSSGEFEAAFCDRFHALEAWTLCPRLSFNCACF